jgi:hypothetical protein
VDMVENTEIEDAEISGGVTAADKWGPRLPTGT